MWPHRLFIFLLLWLAMPLAEAQARLILGAAPEVTPGLASVEQAERLVAALGKALGEEVELRVFHSREELDQWLLKFTMLDLALYDAAFLAKRPGTYLVIGATDGTGKLFITSRQGIAGDLPQRIAKALQQPLAVTKGKASTKSGKQAAPEKPLKAKPVAQVAASQPPSATPATLPAAAIAPEPPPAPTVPPGKTLPLTPSVTTAKPEPPSTAAAALEPVVAPAVAAPPAKPEESSPAKPPQPVAARNYRGEPPPRR